MATWGDSDDDDDVLPARTETAVDARGYKTVVEWTKNAADQKIKTTKEIFVKTVETQEPTGKVVKAQMAEHDVNFERAEEAPQVQKFENIDFSKTAEAPRSQDIDNVETVKNENYVELQAESGPHTEKAEAASPVSRWEYFSEGVWHPFSSEGSNTNIEQAYQHLISGDSDGMVKVRTDDGRLVRVDVRLMLVRPLYQSKLQKCQKLRRLRGSSSDSV